MRRDGAVRGPLQRNRPLQRCGKLYGLGSTGQKQLETLTAAFIAADGSVWLEDCQFEREARVKDPRTSGSIFRTAEQAEVLFGRCMCASKVTILTNLMPKTVENKNTSRRRQVYR
jgi:hypothetical protein